MSTDRQADQGVSLDAQMAKVKAMATVQGLTLLDVVVDGGESAKSLKRPGFQKILSMIEQGEVKAIIVAKLDRLTRSVKDLCGLLEPFEKRGVSLTSVAESLDTATAAGRLVITIMGAVSQWEREAISERTRDALRHKRAQGHRSGNIPFGYRLDADGRTLRIELTEQQAIREAHRLRRDGHPLRSVATRLNEAGHRTRRGGPWRLESVVRVLRQAPPAL